MLYRSLCTGAWPKALASNDHAEIVQFFEVIKEKCPDVEVSFENILKVAQAYVELGEYERGYLVYRATAEGNFMRESRIAGFLDERGEFLRHPLRLDLQLEEHLVDRLLAEVDAALERGVDFDVEPRFDGARQELHRNRVNDEPR